MCAACAEVTRDGFPVGPDGVCVIADLHVGTMPFRTMTLYVRSGRVWKSKMAYVEALKFAQHCLLQAVTTAVVGIRVLLPRFLFASGYDIHSYVDVALCWRRWATG
jgi:hypothetical protein